MPLFKTEHTTLLSSPSDLTEERRAVTDIVTEVGFTLVDLHEQKREFLKGFKLNRLAGACLVFAWLTVSVAAQSIEPIHSFINSGFTSPRNPCGDLILGGDGNFYGTTHFGGNGGFGSVFKVTTTGVLSVLASFDGAHTGGDPKGAVTLGPDGNLYGTTYFSGPNGVGTVFRVAANGVLTTLYSFSRTTSNGSSYTNSDGAYPESGLALGPDGYFYGTTSMGGANGRGSVFKITTNGALAPLFSFSALVASAIGSTNATGASPYGGLTWGPDGNLYGTTMLGGSKADGTVFRITTNGAFTTIVNFVGTNGVGPKTTMTLGPDGNLYGTTVNGGIYGDEGTVFKLTTNGVLTTLVSFNNSGAAPEAGVAFGPDGNLYGTTSSGNSRDGSDQWGTVIRVTTNGILTTLAKFTNTNGFRPEGGVTFGPDGNLYGTTFQGGSDDPNAAGVVYRLNLGLNKPPSISISTGGAVLIHLATTSGSTNLLWATTDLSLSMGKWQVLATNVATNGFSQFTDTNASEHQVRFYRFSTQ
jgi:uncharacterized repeat protein (TIGR03803 family)